MIGVSGAPGTLLLTGSVESEGSGVHKDEMLTQSATYEIEAYRGMRSISTNVPLILFSSDRPNVLQGMEVSEASTVLSD